MSGSILDVYTYTWPVWPSNSNLTEVTSMKFKAPDPLAKDCHHGFADGK